MSKISKQAVTEPKKKKKPYVYNDHILFEYIEEDIHLQVISNERGVYVDIRRFFDGRPSSRGIRMPVDVFERVYKGYAKSDYDVLQDNKENESENMKNGK
jgi:hypothetical protein